MSTNAILHDFATKRLDKPLHNISIKHGEQITEAAGGRLILTENGSPRLRLFFAADPPDQTSELRVGVIVPEHAYATVTAETRCGLKLTASRLFREEPLPHLPGVSEMFFSRMSLFSPQRRRRARKADWKESYQRFRRMYSTAVILLRMSARCSVEPFTNRG